MIARCIVYQLFRSLLGIFLNIRLGLGLYSVAAMLSVTKLLIKTPERSIYDHNQIKEKDAQSNCRIRDKKL